MTCRSAQNSNPVIVIVKIFGSHGTCALELFVRWSLEEDVLKINQGWESISTLAVGHGLGLTKFDHDVLAGFCFWGDRKSFKHLLDTWLCLLDSKTP